MEATEIRRIETRNYNRCKEFMGAELGVPTMQKMMLDGFFRAPASISHHGNEPGGLFEHSLFVAQTLVSLTENNHLKWERPESPKIVGMLHDYCKTDDYCLTNTPVGRYETSTLSEPSGGIVYDYQYRYEYNDSQEYHGHGDKSVLLVSALMRLTEEEIACIYYHMGAFTPKEEWQYYSRAVANYPNVLWTHTADMIASQIEGV